MADVTDPHEPILVHAERLRVGHGTDVILDGVTLDICSGEVFGIVGRAKSGKTALLETLLGLRPPLGGVLTLLGSATPSSPDIRRQVGSSLRPSTVERRTTVEEALAFCARLYECRPDLDALLREVGLADARRRYREDLAPHELARLSLAMGLVPEPRVLFADEPTRELDPAGRAHVWEVLRTRRARGMAVVLSTNLSDEAERLCDRVAVLGHGRVLAIDTPADIVASGRGPSRLTIETDSPIPSDVLAGLGGVRAVSATGSTARLVLSDPVAALNAVADLLRDSRYGMRSLRLSQPTLEDRLVELMEGRAS